MAIGNLKPIKLYEYTETIDANGDAIEEVTNTYKMWAEVTDNGGSRGQEIGRTAMSDTKTFKVNFRGYLITANYKIEYFGQTYAITNVQRVQEKRFNYILSGFCTFEASYGGGTGSPVNFEILQYAGDTGILTFEQGNLGGAYLQVLFKDANNPAANYVNNFNETSTLGPGDFTTLTWPLFTPTDSILIIWYLVDSNTFQQIGQQNSLVINCTRLSQRTFRIYQYNVQNSVLSATTIMNGVDVYNCVGDNIGFATGIDEYISVQNADPVNAQYFQITNYVLQTSGQVGPNYLLTVSPVSPFQQWNPGNTILYLQGA